MKVRIKEKKHNNTVSFAVQIKRGLFWKTLEAGLTLENAQSLVNDLVEMDNFNNNSDAKNKMVYEGWAVRNVYKNTGIGYSLNFFESYPKRGKNDNNSEIIWRDINDNRIPLMEIKAKKLFDKECLEPLKLRITIEQIEE